MREDTRVRAIKHKENRGKSVAMNRAIACARGRWLAVLDADDWYHVDRMARLVAVAERWQVDMIADNQYFYDAAADQVVGPAWPTSSTNWALIFDDFLTGADAYETFNLGMLKPILRTDFVRRTGLGYETAARQGEDFLHLLDFFLSGGKAVVSDTPFYYYTQPYGALSHQWSHPARKRYDFRTAHELNRRYLGAPTPMLPPARLANLETRARRLHALEIYAQAREQLREGQWFEAIYALARHATTWGYVLRRIRLRLTKPTMSKAIDRLAQRARRRQSL